MTIRLDQLLCRKFTNHSRAAIQKWIKGGHVQVNGKVLTKPAQKVAADSILNVDIPPPVDATVAAEAIPLDILYEDPDLIVVNKPAGMVVHPAHGNPRGTLVNALLAHCGRSLSGIGGVARPGIVHRLDKGTSGVMVAAKNDPAHHELSRQFKNREVTKDYLAIVWGRVKPDTGEITTPIGRHLSQRKKMSVRTRRGREAVTLYKVKKQFQHHAFLSLLIKTGRTHQIRVHLSSVGHPIVQDPLYGGRKVVGVALARPALHAWRLAFVHPQSGQKLEFIAPVPHDFQQLLDLLA